MFIILNEFPLQVPNSEMKNQSLTGKLDTVNEGVKECKGWFNKTLPWEELADGQEFVVS